MRTKELVPAKADVSKSSCRGASFIEATLLVLLSALACSALFGTTRSQAAQAAYNFHITVEYGGGTDTSIRGGLLRSCRLAQQLGLPLRNDCVRLLESSGLRGEESTEDQKQHGTRASAASTPPRDQEQGEEPVPLLGAEPSERR